MKILLLGDYSALQQNLKEGLVELGHEVTLVSHGDDWKKLDNDISLQSKRKGLIGKLDRKYFRPIKLIPQLTGYDVIQFIGPLLFSQSFGYNEKLISYLIKHNKKSFLLVAGDNSIYWKNARNLKYWPNEEARAIDGETKYIWNKNRMVRWNTKMATMVNGIIPIVYEYKVGHEKFSNLYQTIPIPVNIKNITYQENIIKNKIIIFHGLNRPGFKGTKYIKKAMEIIKEKFPEKVEIVIKGNIPLKEYLKLIQKTNIIIDQTYGYSYGVNAVFSLALGKVTLAGCEPECLKEFNIESSPVINILPDVDQIVSVLEELVLHPETIPVIGKASRKYAEELHDYKMIAQKYVDTWNNA
ncbi:MAG: glycosyltransferase [Arcobacter sp.]|nr:MAG: glycosyltransferase [Arcobacter sp.]